MIVVERIDATGDTAHQISIRGREIVADMSAPEGNDAGPDPHDLYDSALGATSAVPQAGEAKRP